MNGLLFFLPFFLFVLFSTSNFSYFSPELNQDYFYSRSGDLVIVSSKRNHVNQAQLVTDSKYQLQSKEIGELDVANYFSYLLGLGDLGFGSTPLSTFPEINYFEKPKAELIFVIDGIEEARDLSALKNGISTSVSSEPSNLRTSLSFLTTLFSGSPISEHGIIGSSWWNNLIGEQTFAYLSDLGAAYQPNLASLLAWVSRGKSLISAYSRDLATTSAFSPHSKLISEEKLFDSVEHFHCASYNEETNGVNSVFETPQGFSWAKTKDVVSHEKVVSAFENLKQFEFIQQGSELQVKSGPSQVTFDLTNKVEKEFLAQFVIISSLLSSVENQMELIRDNTPDLFTFALTGLSSCGESQKLEVMQQMTSSFISAVEEKLSRLYQSQIVSSFLLTETHSECEMEKQEKRELAQILKRELGTQLSNPEGVENSLPHVYLSPSLSLGDVNQIFFHIENILRKTQWTVISPVDPLVDVISRQSSSENSTSDDTDLVVYQTSLWTTIALAVAVLMAVYFICCMDTGEDSIIYRPVSQPHQG